MSEEKPRRKSDDDKEVDITFAISLLQYGSVRLKNLHTWTNESKSSK